MHDAKEQFIELDFLLVTLHTLCADGMIVIDCRNNRAHEFQENN